MRIYNTFIHKRIQSSNKTAWKKHSNNNNYIGILNEETNLMPNTSQVDRQWTIGTAAASSDTNHAIFVIYGRIVSVDIYYIDI